MAPSRWTPDPSVRFATEADLPRICEIERLSFEKQWDYDKFKDALRGEFFVFDEGEVVGFLSACCSAVTSTAVILKIAVHPDYRGRGIATRLIAAAVARLKLLRMTEVELHVEIVKRGAIKLYEQLGFKIRRVLTANYEDEEAFYEMKLKLNSANNVVDVRPPEARQ